MPTTTVSPTEDFFKNIDLSQRKEEILKAIVEKINFIPENKTIWESRYWHKGVGAFTIEGTYIDEKGKKYKAVLKVQGSKPKISEPKIIEEFEKQNKSKIIKVPKVFFYLPWNKDLGFEAYVFEKIEGELIINHGKPATKNQLNEFFSAYREYRENSLKKPFITKPKNFSWIKKFKKWRLIRLDNPLKSYITEKEDKRLVEIAELINKAIQKSPLEFQHNHLSCYDIKRVGKRYYLFSNLFWGWNFPLYDSVFSFEWYILSLADYPEKTIKNQIKLWLKTIQEALNNTSSLKNKYKNKVINFHILGITERLLAALNLDLLCVKKTENIKKMKKILWPKLEEFFLKLKKTYDQNQRRKN